MKLKGFDKKVATVAITAYEIDHLIHALAETAHTCEGKSGYIDSNKIENQLRVIKDILDEGELTDSTIDRLCEKEDSR